MTREVSLSNPSLARALNTMEQIRQEPGYLDLIAISRILWSHKWTIAVVSVASMVFGILLFSIGVATYTAETFVVLEENSAELTGVLTRDTDNYDDTVSVIEVFGSRPVIANVVETLDLMNNPEFNRFLSNSVQSPSLFWKLFSWGAPEETSDVAPDLALQSTINETQRKVLFLSSPAGKAIRIVATTTDPAMSAALANAAAEAFLNDLRESRLEASDRIVAELRMRVGELRENANVHHTALRDFINAHERIDPANLETLGDEAGRLRERLPQISAELDMAKRLGDSASVERLNQLQRAIEVSLSDLELTISEQSQHLVQLNQLQQQVDSSKEIYEFSLKRLNEVMLEHGIAAEAGRVIFRASVPYAEDGRGRTLAAIVLGLLGFLGAVAFVLVREATNQTIRTGFDIGSIQQAAKIFEMPSAPKSGKDPNRAFEMRMLLSNEPNRYAEAIRSLRTDLLGKKADRTPLVVQMTSDVMSGARAVQTISLARSFVLVDKRVLVIGADMRDDMLEEVLSIETPKRGLQSALANPSVVNEVLWKDRELGIDLLISEESDENPADILDYDQSFERLILSLKERYDVLLIDTPTLLSAGDAATISRHVDVTILVIGAGVSTKNTLFEAIKALPHGLRSRDAISLYGAEPFVQNRALRQSKQMRRI